MSALPWRKDNYNKLRMKLSQFKFPLTREQIASEPPRWRDECRLMVLHKDTGEIEHRLFKDIIDYFGISEEDRDLMAHAMMTIPKIAA